MGVEPFQLFHVVHRSSSQIAGPSPRQAPGSDPLDRCVQVDPHTREDLIGELMGPPGIVEVAECMDDSEGEEHEEGEEELGVVLGYQPGRDPYAHH